jgi:protein-tyrosine phosphatase
MSLHWITANDLQVAIAPRPRGQDWLSDDINEWKRAGTDVIVSALTAAEIDELGLAAEEECCRVRGIEFISFPIEDRSVPSSVSEFNKLLDLLNGLLASRKSVVIHCRAGIGRSSIIAASLLIKNGLSAGTAFQKIEKARGFPVPDTPEQRRWVEDYLGNS